MTKNTISNGITGTDAEVDINYEIRICQELGMHGMAFYMYVTAKQES